MREGDITCLSMVKVAMKKHDRVRLQNSLRVHLLNVHLTKAMFGSVVASTHGPCSTNVKRLDSAEGLVDEALGLEDRRQVAVDCVGDTWFGALSIRLRARSMVLNGIHSVGVVGKCVVLDDFILHGNSLDLKSLKISVCAWVGVDVDLGC